LYETGDPPSLNTILQISCNGNATEYLLRGVIYYANHHFTAYFLNSAGNSWGYDGMSRGGTLIQQRPVAVYALKVLELFPSPRLQVM